MKNLTLERHELLETFIRTCEDEIRPEEVEKNIDILMPTITIAYNRSRRKGAAFLDFDSINVICDPADFFERLVKSLKALGFKTFTISCQSTALMEELFWLTKYGAKIVGMIEVESGYTDWDGNMQYTPAVKLELI